jgi:hypothetical protein
MRKFWADLHVHSNFSDGKLTIPQLVDFYGERKFGAIAITDHICENNTFFGLAANYLKYTLTPATFPIYMEILKSEAVRAWKTYQMVVIPGFEISKNSWRNHRSAHVLGLGIQEYISAEGDIAEILTAIRGQNALTIAAHPVSTGKFEKQTYHLWDRRKELAPLIDAWEVASGPVIFEQVLKSGLPMIANSDLHHPGQIRSWKTLFSCDRTQDAILEAVRTQDVEFQFYQEKNNHDDIGFEHRFDLLAPRSRARVTGNLAHA